MRTTVGMAAMTLGSAASIVLVFETTEVPAAATNNAAELLDPAYVAGQICGPIPKQRTELYKPGLQIVATAPGATAEHETAQRSTAIWVTSPIR